MQVDYTCCEWLSSKFFMTNPLYKLLIRNQAADQIMSTYLQGQLFEDNEDENHFEEVAELYPEVYKDTSNRAK